MLVTSSLSRMLNWGLRPSAAPSWRSMRTPSAWKVHTSTDLASRPIRPLGALAHFGGGLVGEGDGRNALGSSPRLISRAILWVITRVLPDPAPASTRQARACNSQLPAAQG
jgi:hypothetical protein